MSKQIDQTDLIGLHEFDFGKVYFYHNFLITEIAEGVNFDHPMALQIAEVANNVYENRPYGYIANRINSFSVQPSDYQKVKGDFVNLKVFCVVAYNDFQKKSIEVEQIFYHDTIYTFNSLDEAINFVENRISEM